MQTGWIDRKGKWYYWNGDGVMVSNQIITLHDSTFSKFKQKPFAKYVNTLNRAIYVKALYQNSLEIAI